MINFKESDLYAKVELLFNEEVLPINVIVF